MLIKLFYQLFKGIWRSLDYYDGGPRYNTSYIQCCGLGTVTDNLSALKKHVFEDKTFSLDRVLNALLKNFEGEELLRQTIINRTPFFGNDNDYTDSIAVKVYNDLVETIDGKSNIKPGGKYHLNMLSTTCHVYFGKVMGASPNGRFPENQYPMAPLLLMLLIYMDLRLS